jgi:hypothetical protein
LLLARSTDLNVNARTHDISSPTIDQHQKSTRTIVHCCIEQSRHRFSGQTNIVDESTDRFDPSRFDAFMEHRIVDAFTTTMPPLPQPDQ